jgi:PEGA domain-containing protein
VVTPINPGPNLPPKPEIKKNEPAPVPVLNGYVSLNIQPWAEIREVKDAAGKILSSKVLVTPCKLELPAGKYQITLANPDFKTMVLNIEVKDQETTIIKRKLEGFNYARAVDSLDL